MDAEVGRYIHAQKRERLCVPKLEAMESCEKRDNCVSRMEYLIDCHTTVVLHSETHCKS